MPDYRNGYVPAELMVVFNRGWNATDGHWTHAYPPATYARHLALIARGKARTGRTLALNYGWTAYRPYAAQVLLKGIFGIGAATPGTSSHGGFWEGRQTMAGDYSNWAWVYENHGGRAAFAEDCRAVGLLPNMIVPARGYPDEPWHVIDPNPWSSVPAFAGVVVLPFDPAQPTTPEDDMFTDDDRALLANVKTKLDVALRNDYLPLMDKGMFGEIMARLDRLQGAPHPTRNDYGRVMDAGDLGQILNAIAALTAEIAPQASASIAAIADAVADEIAERLNE